MRFTSKVFIACAVLFVSLTAMAQNTPATGIYPFGSFDAKGFDTINRGNLNVHFTIPIITKQGRGGTNFYYALTYDGLIWSPTTSSGTTMWTPSYEWGWTDTTNAEYGYITYDLQTTVCSFPPGGLAWSENNFVYHDAHGFSHYFPMAWTQACDGPGPPPSGSGTYSTSDNSGYTIYRSGGTYTVFSRSGTQSTVLAVANLGGGSTQSQGEGAGTFEDTNGNEITATSSGTFTDTTGKTVLTITGSGTATSPTVYTYTDSNGKPDTVTVNYTNYNIKTNFGVSGTGEYSKANVPLVSSIVYSADGSSYSFTYEPTPGTPSDTTGRLASVTLRTGGTISYAYSGGYNGIESLGATANLERTTSDGSTMYTRSGSTTTIVNPAGNTGVYTFLMNSSEYYFETAHSLYSGGVSGTPLEQVSTCYNTAYPCSSQNADSGVSSLETNTVRNGVTIGTDTKTFTSVGLLASDVGPTGITTTNKYDTFTGPNQIAFYRLSSSSNGQSSTTYNYDESTPKATSGLPQHVAVSTSRGNLTSVHADGYTQTLTYDTAGQLLSESDYDNNFTTFGYDSSTDTFLTGITYPANNGIALSVGYVYDIQTGLMTSSTDANGNTTSYHYDGLLRPTEIDYPDGGKTVYGYPSANQVSLLQYQTASTYADTETLYDSYGRVSRIAVANGQPTNPWYQKDTCYNSDGEVGFVSYPYQGTGWGTPQVCSGAGDSYAYDGLARVTNLKHGDGSNIGYSYDGLAAETTDENGVSRIVQTDAVGRPTIVCEISSNASMPDSGSPQSCGTTIAGTGFITSYSYDWANAKVTITQGAQTRVFQTDSLGRTTLVQEPESGQTTYSYAYNSTGLQVTRQRPKANQTTPSVLTTTTTQYDKLGRVVSISYNDGITPNKEFDYDAVNAAMQWSESVTNLKGRLADMASGSGATLTRDLFSYDSMGRVTAMWQCAPSICGTSSQAGRPLTFAYDWAGDLTSESDLASGPIAYTVSPAGEVTSITNEYYAPSGTYGTPASLAASVQNGPDGPLNWQMGNGLYGVRAYDSMGRNDGGWVCKNSSAAYCSGGTKLYGYTIGFKGTRALSGCDTVLGQCVNYGYDDFNRLSSLTVTSGTQQNFTYVYDRYGNRWQQNVTAGSGPAPQLNFNVANNEITNSGYAYDAAGDMTNDGTNSYTYDAEGNVIAVDNGSTASYVYDALNRRVRVQTANATDEYIYDYAGRRISTWLPGGAGTEGRIYWGNLQYAFRALNAQTYFDEQNWLGTERERTNYTGGSVNYYQSLPYGNGYLAQYPGSYGDQDNSHFTGMERDAESDTDHAQFRQYGNMQGRWMSPDPYTGSYDLGNPQSFDRYSYAWNNPTAFTDPSGLYEASCYNIAGCNPGLFWGGGVPHEGGGKG